MAQLLIRGGLVHDAVHEIPFVADILCENGKIAAEGDPEEVSKAYLALWK